MDLADVSKGAAGADTRAPHVSESKGEGARWTWSTRGLGRNGGPAAFREREPADGSREDLGRMGEEVRRGREGSQRHESLVGGENWRRMRTGARGTVFRSGAKRRLESAAAVEGGGARGDGASEAGRGNGADAGVRHGMAKLMAHLVRRGDGGSSGGARLEIAGERRRWGSAWRAR
uniref:Uncharacterized protein n=1 Tax=Oryza sativa subsp. japonica TaxID=39947 RepID=Q6YTP8_ORYSJ|nr:hypothetical protein [Oryza sativa Japonica Group]